MLVLFSSIFATMSVIEDRHQGFLQGVLVAPGSRASVVLGKALASTTVALIQAALFVLLAPLAGFPLGRVAWAALTAALALTALGLAGLGFTIAWWLDSTQGYHVVMSLVLFPAWILSGAMFPPEGLPPAMRAILRFNPMSYSVAALRRALHGGTLPPGTGLPGVGSSAELAVVTALAFATLASAAWYCSRTPAAA
jgi:ABC-type polysaccharide/polyol phosphate export permease